MNIAELLSFAVKSKASDLHLSAGAPPMMRVDGDLCSINFPVIGHKELVESLYELMNDLQKNEFELRRELDFSFEIADLSRLRVNIFHQLRGAAAVFRIIPTKILSRHELGLPLFLEEMVHFSKGLVLVTGSTGSGKSTTLAALIDSLNSTGHGHILTVEDPIEFVHHNKKCLINQREVHRDTLSFNAALRSALREDPDVILVGELRDPETIRLALTAAETGHLVLATLHTNSATQAVHRIIDVFPAEEKPVIGSMLSESLQAIIAQTLVKKKGGGRIAALEIMVCTHAIRHLIRDHKLPQMYSFIQTGKDHGMHTLDQHLMALINQNIISYHTAYEVAIDKGHFLKCYEGSLFEHSGNIL